MFLIIKLLAAMVLSAHAQQAQSPEIQAMAQKLSQEITLGVQCNIQNINLMQENTRLKAEIEELKKNPGEDHAN